MSRPYSRFLHPNDVAQNPVLEPEIKRAILASWASDKSAVRDQPGLRKPPGVKQAIPIDEILEAMREIDDMPRLDNNKDASVTANTKRSKRH